MGIADRETSVKIDIDAVRAGVAAICQANAITTDAGWSAHINARTDAQILTMVRNFFKSLINLRTNGSG